MPPYLWTSIEPEQHDRDTAEGDTRDTKGIKDASLRSENEEAHKTTNLLTETPRQEGHVLNVDRWATLQETAKEEGSRRALTSSTTATRTQSTSHLSLHQGIAWLQ